MQNTKRKTPQAEARGKGRISAALEGIGCHSSGRSGGGLGLAGVLLVKLNQSRADFVIGTGSCAPGQGADSRLNAAAKLGYLHLGKARALQVCNECFPVHALILFANRYFMQRISDA